MSEFSETIAEWKEKGYIKFVKWHTVNDDEVCEVCRERAEKEFLLDEIDQLIPAHEGCRCWITPIVSAELINKQREELWKGVDFDV